MCTLGKPFRPKYPIYTDYRRTWRKNIETCSEQNKKMDERKKNNESTQKEREKKSSKKTISREKEGEKKYNKKNREQDSIGYSPTSLIPYVQKPNAQPLPLRRLRFSIGIFYTIVRKNPITGDSFGVL